MISHFYHSQHLRTPSFFPRDMKKDVFIRTRQQVTSPGSSSLSFFLLRVCADRPAVRSSLLSLYLRFHKIVSISVLYLPSSPDYAAGRSPSLRSFLFFHVCRAQVAQFCLYHRAFYFEKQDYLVEAHGYVPCRSNLLLLPTQIESDIFFAVPSVQF